MSIRIAVGVVLLTLSLPGRAFSAQGILLLADEGTTEWHGGVTQLAQAVDKQKATELAFWSATNPNIQAAVDRLVQRGVSEIVAVPLFVAALPSDFSARVKTSVPLRITAGLNNDAVAGEIVLDRAGEVSTNSKAEVVVLVSHRSAAGNDQRWVPDLAAAARHVNQTRRFAMIITTTLPPTGSDTPPEETANLRRMVEREIARQRRIIVVPVLTSYGGTEAAIEEQLRGLAHEVTTSALMPHDRLVAWIVSRVEAAPLAADQPKPVR
jgi:hypothetical protein